MPKLFGVNIAGILNKELAPGLLRGKLYSPQDVIRDPDNPTVGLAADGGVITHNFQGIIQSYSDDEIDNNLILKEDRKILIIAESLKPSVVPATGMYIEMSDAPGVWIVVSVARDPASATYICQGRL